MSAEPYYADDLVTLYHGDCREITAWLDADALVTDPPYGRNWQSGSRLKNGDGRGLGSKPHGGIANDVDTSVRDTVLDLWGDRVALVFGDPLIAKPHGAVQAMIYGKPVDAGVKGARGGRRRDVEMIWMVGPWPAAVGGRTSILRTSSLVAGPTGAAARLGHPHAKPVDLMGELVAMTAGVIADPCAGVGSTLVAARLADRRSIGVELDERYCEIAARRLDQGVLDFEVTA